ncbi:hypothetical protein GOP47_0002938 [Adiantum capillus-veneris]|uniref:Uncharacterized protein n=1 Tax=Adiantum capillus-veneris TaxID=13818 RepID=A0A9D4VBV7_ADICA|nr:hypothetical protein GOP47_0002938 [Adiantum capillus-veneris]
MPSLKQQALLAGQLPEPGSKDLPILDLKHAAASQLALMSAPHPSRLNLARLLHREFDQMWHTGIAPSPSISARAAICNAADTLITCLLSPLQLQPAVDPRIQLLGNAFPVLETPPTACSVVGTLPSDLNGAYIRNGPNPAYLHSGEGCHFFDGDGMLHSVKIRHGSAPTYCARFVKTSRFLQEEAAGRPLFPKLFGSLTGALGMARTAVMLLRASLGLLDLSQGVGLSNTSVGFFKGKLLSMSEEDMPYVIKLTEAADLETQGRLQLGGIKGSMCAHPKIDPETGDMYGFSYPQLSLPRYSIFKASARAAAENAEKSADDIDDAVVVVVPGLFDLPIVHDFAITRKYIVFPDSELVVRALPFLRGEALAVRDKRKVARFCVLPRDIFDRPHEAAHEVRWFDAPACNCLHFINAWDDEESQEVVLIAPIIAPLDNVLSLTGISTTVTEIRLNLHTGTVCTRKLCTGRNCDLGTMNPRYVGCKSRYAYFAEGSSFPHGVIAVVKLDVQSGCVVARRTFEAGCTCGEPCFVSRHQWAKGSSLHLGNETMKLEEDDGYLLCFVHNNNIQCSELLVMNALSSSLEVIASVQIPIRVPFGLHGFFVSDYQLCVQNPHP